MKMKSINTSLSLEMNNVTNMTPLKCEVMDTDVGRQFQQYLNIVVRPVILVEANRGKTLTDCHIKLYLLHLFTGGN